MMILVSESVLFSISSDSFFLSDKSIELTSSTTTSSCSISFSIKVSLWTFLELSLLPGFFSFNGYKIV